jgi:hypothetical protein
MGEEIGRIQDFFRELGWYEGAGRVARFDCAYGLDISSPFLDGHLRKIVEAMEITS